MKKTDVILYESLGLRPRTIKRLKFDNPDINTQTVIAQIQNNPFYSSDVLSRIVAIIIHRMYIFTSNDTRRAVLTITDEYLTKICDKLHYRYKLTIDKGVIRNYLFNIPDKGTPLVTNSYAAILNIEHIITPEIENWFSITEAEYMISLIAYVIKSIVDNGE